MLFQLDDFNEAPLRNAAVQLKIPNAANLPKADLVREITAKVSPTSELVFIPCAVGDGKGKRWPWSNILSISLSAVALIVAIVSSISGWRATIEVINKNAAEQESKTALQWESAIVYSIIEEGSKNTWDGISFNDIRDKYVTAATAEKDINIRKERLQPLELRTILIALLAEKLIWQTATDRYVTVRTGFITGAGKDVEITRAVGSILQILAKKSGEYTVSSLEADVVKEAQVVPEIYYIAINSLLAQQGVTFGKDNKLYSASHPPPDSKK